MRTRTQTRTKKEKSIDWIWKNEFRYPFNFTHWELYELVGDGTWNQGVEKEFYLTNQKGTYIDGGSPDDLGSVHRLWDKWKSKFENPNSLKPSMKHYFQKDR